MHFLVSWSYMLGERLLVEPVEMAYQSSAEMAVSVASKMVSEGFEESGESLCESSAQQRYIRLRMRCIFYQMID